VGGGGGGRDLTVGGVGGLEPVGGVGAQSVSFFITRSSLRQILSRESLKYVTTSPLATSANSGTGDSRAGVRRIVAEGFPKLPLELAKPPLPMPVGVPGEARSGEEARRPWVGWGD
jgi:hypothetical protein